MQVGNNLNKEDLAFLQHKGMANPEKVIDSTTVITYALMQ